MHEYSHRTQNHTTLLSTVVQPAMSMQLFRCIQLVIYPPAFCIGEISLEERVVGVGGKVGVDQLVQTHSLEQLQGTWKSLVPCEEVLIAVPTHC